MKEGYLQNYFNFDSDSLLGQFLRDDPKGFTLANYVDYMAEKENQEALCHVDRNGNKRTLTYQDLKDISNQMANYLKEKGVKKGDVVALVLRNNLEFFPLVLAIQKLGGVVMPLQYMSKNKQYKSIFERANPTCIIAEDYELKQNDGQSIYVLDEINKSLSLNLVKLCVNRRSSYSKEWDDMGKWENYSKEFQPEDVNTTDWGYLLATSGTTGSPKLVMHNYGFALANYYTGSWYGVEKGKKHFTICDSGWAMALWSMSGVLLHQGVLYINDYDRFNAEEILKRISEENIYSLCAPRSTLKKLLQALSHKPNLWQNNLKSLASAGEPLSQCDRQVIKSAFGLDLKEGYGMTEVVLPIYESSSGN